MSTKNYPDVLVNYVQDCIREGNNVNEIASMFSESLKSSFEITSDELFEELKYYISEMYYYKNIRLIIIHLKELSEKYKGYNLTVFRDILNRKMSQNDIFHVFKYYDKKCLPYLLDNDINYPIKHFILDMLEMQSDFDYSYELNKNADNDTNMFLIETIAILNRENNENKQFLINELEKIIKDYK